MAVRACVRPADKEEGGGGADFNVGEYLSFTPSKAYTGSYFYGRARAQPKLPKDWCGGRKTRISQGGRRKMSIGRQRRLDLRVRAAGKMWAVQRKGARALNRFREPDQLCLSELAAFVSLFGERHEKNRRHCEKTL